MTKLAFQVVDAFTSTPFTGNPASVIVLEHGDLSDDVKQKIGAEFNLSETAFLLPLPGNSPQTPKFQIRWFTPSVEAPLCGHATIASAHVLFSNPVYVSPEAESIEFASVFSGTLYARRSLPFDGTIVLDFPYTSSRLIPPASAEAQKVIEGVVRASGGEWEGKLDEVRVGVFGEPPSASAEEDGKRTGHYVVRLAEGTKLEGVPVNPSQLVSSASGGGRRGTAVTVAAEEGGEFHFYSRLFAPASGIPEDPVTGSLHALLGPYWASDGAKNLKNPVREKGKLRAKQVSTRGGILDLDWHGGDRVKIGGKAVTVSKGEIEF
ncbi:Diaminopimelate epimerase-like protein [Atractiella rhizophila]|nr:Diaminopimelate epimerase-like protein [Atractiella rhizophila]